MRCARIYGESSVIIFGVHPVEEILAAAPQAVRSIMCSRVDAVELATIRQHCEARGIWVQAVKKEELDNLAEGNHQGVVAELHGFNYGHLPTVLDKIGDSPLARIVVLDQIQDPQNLGAILRSSAGLGVDAVLIPKDRAAAITATVIRASAGLAFRVPVIQVTNIARTLEELKEVNFWTVGTFMDNATPCWDMDFRMRTALVLGSEHKGVRPLVEKKCDFRVSIPMGDGTESLNVATAASILLYEIKRQCR